MFGLIKKVFIRLLTGLVNWPNHKNAFILTKGTIELYIFYIITGKNESSILTKNI